MSNNVTGVKISQFNVSDSLADSDVIPFVRSGANLTATFATLKGELGVTGTIDPTGSGTSTALLFQPAGGINFIRNVKGERGVVTLTAGTGEVIFRNNFANDPTGEGVLVDPTAAQFTLKSIVGGTNTNVSTVGNTIVIDVEDADPLTSQTIVRSAADFDNPLDPNTQYLIDGVIDMGSTELNIGANGANIRGLGSEVSSITSTAAGYTLFNGASAGNLFINDVTLTTSGAGSQVFDITDSDGTHAAEFSGVNFTACSSLGTINGYRQGLEFNIGRFGGKPELTLAGTMNGWRANTTIVRGAAAGTVLYKAGAGLVFGGRFITDFNVDLPATGALFDFSASNITNDESLIVDGAFVTRNGVLDASDSTLYPNINHQSVKSNWGNNTGLPNTRKYIKGTITTEVATALSGQPVSTYLPLAGTVTINNAVQFDEPANGEYRLLTGNGLYLISGTVLIAGTAGDVIDLRVTLSTDNGVTFPTEINHIQQEIPNFIGTDFATYSVNFIQELKKDDRIRLEVENNTAARNVTGRLESYLIVSEV